MGNSEEEPIAEITFLPKGTDAYIVNRTFVSESLRGKGVGLQLLDRMVELARKENKKIIPKCSFVKIMMNRKEEYKDMLAKE